MNDELLKILANSSEEIDNQKLLNYLSGHLTGKEKREVEELMSESDFVNDAIEGLQEVSGKVKIEALVEQLNNDLHKKLEQKKSRKNKKKLKEYSWIYFSIIIILVLTTVAWFVIYLLRIDK